MLYPGLHAGVLQGSVLVPLMFLIFINDITDEIVGLGRPFADDTSIGHIAQDLCKVKILSNASCNCGAPCANSHHFFFDCDKHTDNREIIFNILSWLPSNIDVNLLTKGSDLLTYEENITIFKHAFKYIKDSKRFTIV